LGLGQLPFQPGILAAQTIQFGCVIARDHGKRPPPDVRGDAAADGRRQVRAGILAAGDMEGMAQRFVAPGQPRHVDADQAVGDAQPLSETLGEPVREGGVQDGYEGGADGRARQGDRVGVGAFRMLPEKGMQTRRDYTMAAHFAYLRRLMPKVGKWRFFLDQDPGMRAAVMSAFVEEIKAETCDAWFVRINKDLTIDKRRQARRIARLQFESVKAANPGLSDREVVREMIKTAHAAMTQHGNWNDRWLDHPYPNMSEPEKAVSWLTERPTFTPDHAASLYAMASLHGVDSLFNQMRRRSRLLERPIHTSSGSGRVWSAYSAYDPAQTMRLIEIVRVCHNFVWPGEKDGKTPAMRLGLARAPIDYADILAFVP